MAAECEINDCGVLAIGRCARCGRAMCESHRALGQGGVPVVNACVACQQKEAAKAKSEADRLLSTKKAIRLLMKRLAAAGVRGEKVYHATKMRKTRFGGWRSVEDPGKHLYGYFVGEHMWRYEYYNEGIIRSDELCRTFITEDGRLKGGRGISGHVPPYPEYEPISWDSRNCPISLSMPETSWHLEFMEHVLLELNKLARQHGVDPEEPALRESQSG